MIQRVQQAGSVTARRFFSFLIFIPINVIYMYLLSGDMGARLGGGDAVSKLQGLLFI
jgi:hypothetical protein